MRKNKTSQVVDKEKKGLTPSEQNAVNREWEKLQNEKLPKGGNAAISEAAYANWKKTGKLNYTYYNPVPKDDKPKVEIGTLKTRGIPKANVSASIQRSKTYSKPMAEDKKFKPEAGAKKLTRGGNSVVGSNIKTAVKNKVNEARFNKQKQQSKASDRALKGEGTVSNKVAALKDQKRDIKQARKETALSRQSARTALKDTRAGIKYEKKLAKGKAIYKK